MAGFILTPGFFSYSDSVAGHFSNLKNHFKLNSDLSKNNYNNSTILLKEMRFSSNYKYPYLSYLKNKLIILTLFLLTGCSSIPTNTANSCLIFDERYLWYKHSKKAEQK